MPIDSNREPAIVVSPYITYTCVIISTVTIRQQRLSVLPNTHCTVDGRHQKEVPVARDIQAAGS